MPGLATLLLTVSLAPVATDIQDQRDAQLARCASIPDDVARLACFDAYTGRAASKNAANAETAPNPVAGISADAAEIPIEARSTEVERAPDQAQAESATARSGNAESSAAAAGEQEADIQVARIEAFVRLKRSNRIRITLDNGQVWQENDGAPFRGNIEPGTEITITRGRFGGYRMTVPMRSAAIFVRRVK